MNWNGKLIILLSLLLFLACNQKQKIQFPKQQNVDLIPAPNIIRQKAGFFSINNNVELVANRFSDRNLSSLKSFINELNITPGGPKGVIIINKFPFDDDYESYNLFIEEDSIFLLAESEIGIQHGINTLKQLILLNQFNGNFFVPQLEIEDKTKFQHRGLLLDCSRHFFKKETIKKYIDLLALYKMNVLHWHLTEDQGWRLTIDKYPKLNSIASKRTELDGSEYGGIYTKNDVQEIVTYATSKGIEIIPEIELPGHSQAAIAAYPHLSCKGEQVNVANDWGVFKEIYCAGNDSVFTFLENVLTEVIDLFPSQYIHIGGDEAPKTRWENCSKCQKRIKDEGLEDEHELQSYFIKRIQRFLNGKGKEIIGWDEILEGGLSKGAIVQSWRGFDGGINAAKQGNYVIMSPTSHAYLDYDLKAIDLEKVYNFNPIPKELDSSYHPYIIGGECNMWTEHVPNSKILDQKVFPRMLGMSEALWSTKEKNYKDFKIRVQSQYRILDYFNVQYGAETVPFTYKTNTSNEQLSLELIPSDTILSLQYSTDLDSSKKIYNNPLDITSSSTYTVQAYKNGKTYEYPKEIPLALHKGINANFEYLTPYNQWYTAGGETALGDGKLGTLDFRDENWQGFWGTDAVVVVDFNKKIKSKEIQMNFYQYNNSWIFIPPQVSILYSSDKINWKPFNDNKLEFGTNPKKRGKFIETIHIKSEEERQFKYLKVIVKNLGKVPDWHEAAGSDAWIFMDEIQVK